MFMQWDKQERTLTWCRRNQGVSSTRSVWGTRISEVSVQAGCRVRRGWFGAAFIIAAGLLNCLVILGSSAMARSVNTVIIGTSSLGSAYYTLSVGMSEIISKYTDLNATVFPAGGADATLRAIGDGRANLGMVHTWSLEKAYAGNHPFDKPIDLRQLLWGQESGNYLIARADSGIETPYDLVGKRIVGRRPALQSIDEYTYVLLDVYGIDPSSVRIIQTVETNEAILALRQGTVDAVVLPGGIAAPHIVQLAQTTNVRFVEIAPDKLQQMIARMPSTFIATNPPGTYRGYSGELAFISWATVLAASPSLPNDVAYKVTKAIIEHREELSRVHAAGQRWTLENTLRTTGFGVPFHPGAVEYFKERGVWTRELEARQQALLQAKR